jgi:DNA-binding NtrC family response regulator
VNSEEITSFLNKASIFSSLEEEDLKPLASLLKSRQVPAGEIVIHQGEFGDSIFFICQGEVDIFFQNEEGAESVIGHLKEGNLFGEMALLTGSPRSASVKVTRDALFLVLHKSDFDLFLKEHPHLALFFSKILAERIRTTTLRYVHQIGREEQLKKLLSREEEQHLTRLIGRTRQFQAIEKKIDEHAETEEPLIIVGPKGTATDDVARLIHLKSRREGHPFMMVDLGGGDEWKIYLSRIRPLVKTPEEEEHISEEFQISTLFGHERGAMLGTAASRLGHIELANGGTVVLKHLDRLYPATRERLLLYLLEKRFYRLGGKDSLISDVRILASLNTSEGSEEVKRVLRGKIPDPLWNNWIDLPPLAMRRRDIPVIAETFLEKHALLMGKPVKSISPQAINILVRYSWPGNDRELESVIERGVLVCDGESLLAEHIFLGLTPYTEKGRVNLLRFEAFRNLFASGRARSALQACMIPVLVLVVLLSLFGIRVGNSPLGTGLFWCFMVPYLLVSYVVLGRIYCSFCPMIGLARLFRKLGSKERPAPRLFNHIGVAIASIFALVFLWFETVFAIREIPYVTAIFILFLMVTAVSLNLVFREEVWCRYLCPMGYLGGLFSCLAPVELRANNNVCSSQCKSAACYQGTDKSVGCPMSLFPVSVTSNQFCKMCGTCVRNCQYKSIHLDLRWPGAELWENREPNKVASLSIPALLGVLYPLILYHKLSSAGWLPFTLWFLASALLSLALFLGASFVKGSQNGRTILGSHGFAYLPLTFAGHIAIQVPFIQEGLRWLATIVHGNGVLAPDPLLVQRLFISLGILWSLWTLKNLFKQEDWLVTTVHGTLILLFGISLFLILGL